MGELWDEPARLPEGPRALQGVQAGAGRALHVAGFPCIGPTYHHTSPLLPAVHLQLAQSYQDVHTLGVQSLPLTGTGPKLPRHAPTPACIPKPAAFLPGLTGIRSPSFRPSPAHPHQHPRPGMSCIGGRVPRDPVPVSLPTTLGSFCLRSGIRGSFMLMRLKRPHSRCGAFFLPRVSSLRGRGLSEGAGPAGVGSPPEPELRRAGPHPRAGPQAREGRAAGTPESGRRRASPARRVLAAAGAAAAEQREQQAEEQGQQRPRAHHALALVGLCGKASGSGRAPAPRAPSSTRCSLNHSPRRQAPVTGSHESSWQLQAWAQSTPWSPGGHVRLQLRGHRVRKGHSGPP